MIFILDCLSFLPYLCLLFTIFYFSARRKSSLYQAITAGSIVWSLLIILETNLLSYFNLIAQTPILIFWILYGITWTFLSIPLIKGFQFNFKFSARYLPITIILALTLLAALAYAPDFHDSLAYHLPRIRHWLQNGSLAPYLTSIDRQIGMAPFNAMVILQSMAIDYNDYFVNLPQWLAFAGTICGVMQIASQLGANTSARLLAGFYFATVPIAIMQSGNSESSLIATFWLCIFTSAFLTWWQSPNWRDSFILGASLGLAILSKGIAYPVALPFVACIGWQCLRHFKSCFLYGLLAAALILTINLPHFYRNYQATDSFVLSAERNIITKPYPALIAGNALFNFMLQEPWLVSIYGKKNWSDLGRKFGIDDHDPTYFPWRGVEYIRGNLVPSDIDGQSPIHTLLILFFIPLLIWRRIPGTGLYLGLECATFFIFFAILTSQPWGARLHLPFFMLSAPLMGMELMRLPWRKLRNGIIALLGLFSVFPLFFCLEHPLGPPSWLSEYRENILHFSSSSRDEQYFNFWRHMRKGYMAAVEYLANQQPKSIGLDLADDGQEYPVWGMLQKRMSPMPRIIHTLPPYPNDESGPDYIFKQHHSSFSDLPDPIVYKKKGHTYEQVFPEKP